MLVPMIVSGQLTPDGDAWNYDDGYVLTDVSGAGSGFTWYWGYISSGQLAGEFIVFHRLGAITNNEAELITDSFPLNGVLPPSPPYDGTFGGAGPVISDTASRTITSINVSATLTP